MDSSPRRATERLHTGRVSVSGATYFVTLVTEDRAPWLKVPAATAAMLSELRAWHAERDGAILAATVMPDHVHVLFVLGDRLDVGRCVSRWKTLGRKSAGYAGGWQRDFWEHWIREQALWEEYALYIYLNPYRIVVENGSVAGMVGAGASEIRVHHHAWVSWRTTRGMDRVAG